MFPHNKTYIFYYVAVCNIYDLLKVQMACRRQWLEWNSFFRYSRVFQLLPRRGSHVHMRPDMGNAISV
jgi:hypothetical protein